MIAPCFIQDWIIIYFITPSICKWPTQEWIKKGNERDKINKTTQIYKKNKFEICVKLWNNFMAGLWKECYIRAQETSAHGLVYLLDSCVVLVNNLSYYILKLALSTFMYLCFNIRISLIDLYAIIISYDFRYCLTHL